VSNGLPGLTLPPPTALQIPSVASPTIPAAFSATLKAVADGAWNSAATWGGRLPVDGDIVEIPRGRSVQIAGATARLNGLWVNGALTFSDSDVAITTKFVMVHGRLQAGTETQPYARSASITLFGADATQDVLGMGIKTISVGPGGLLKLHGEQRLAWTKLSATVQPGASSMTLKDDATTWRVGDKLLIVASGFDPREAEVVTVTGVNGANVSFSPALKYRHVGLTQTYDGKTLDQRAAVGLLSRNIVIRGADDSDATAFGGHVMIMGGGHAQVSGVELTKMGQRGNAGRYPFHWHIAGDRTGNYLMSSSIHSSFQRAAVVHSTHNVVLDGNVVYDVPNHALVWAEDGDEFGNTLTRNLVALVRQPEEQHFAFRINNAFHGNSSQGEHRSAAYWGRSYNKHVIRDNISAGVLDGFGFFFDTFTPAPNGGDEGGGLVFDGNIAHSTHKTFATGNQINYPEATRGHGLMVSTGTSGKYQHLFTRYTGYHNVSGAWVEDRPVKLKDSVLADNGVGVMVLRASLEGITVVGQSAHPLQVPNLAASVNFGERAGIQVAGSNHGGKRAPLILDTTIINQTGFGILWDLDNISPASVINQVRFVNTPKRTQNITPFGFEFFPDSPQFGVTDFSGAYAGDQKVARVFMRDANLEDANCTALLDALAYSCPTGGSLLLKSAVNLTLVEDSGRTTMLKQFDYYDAGMPDDGAVSYVGNGRAYSVLASAARSRYDFTLEDAQNKSLELSFAAASTASRIVQAGQNVSAAASLAAMRSAAGSAFFYDAAQKRLHLRLIGGQGAQAVSVEAPFTASGPGGLEAVALPAGAVDGFAYSAVPASAKYQFKYGVPSAAAARSGAVNAVQIDSATAQAALQSAKAGDTTLLRGYIYAPADGLYRLGLWGSGGGTSLWVGNTHVMSEPYANINSNWVKNGQLDTEFGVFHPNGLVALKAGWHQITAVHAKMPDATGTGGELYLRWIPPGNTNSWVYPQVKRAP
jgi:hypothetical protein